MEPVYKKVWNRAAPTVQAWVHWSVLAVLTGVVCGAAGAAFYHAIGLVTAWRGAHPWLLLGMPLAGVAIVWLYQVCGMENDSGTNQIIASVRSGQRPPLRLAPLIFVGSVLTHLTGGSAGREGAALQIGGSLACQVGQRLHLGEREMNVEVMCGMSGLFAALFSTPLTAAVFAIEVISVGIVHYSAFFPCLLTALVSMGVTVLLGVEGEHYTLAVVPTLEVTSLVQIGVLGVGCALLAMVFCVVVHQTGHWYVRFFRNPYLRAVAGGVLVVAISLMEGSRDYNGAGMDVIAAAVEQGTARPEAFLLKILFTAVTLSAGFKGGEVVPSFFVGAAFGCVAGPLLGIPAETAEEGARYLRQLAEGDYAVIYITEDLASRIEAEMDYWKSRPLPAIIPIPGVSGNTGIGMKMVKKSVEQAVGADII